MSEAATPSDGALTVDQAIAVLNPSPAAEPAPEAPLEAAEEATEPQATDQVAEEAEAGAEPPAEAEETEVDPEPVVAADPPKYWSQDAKEAFGQLPPDLQAVVLAQEGPREEAAAKAKADAAKEVEAVESERRQYAGLVAAMAEQLPQWVQTFKSRWGDAPDWAAMARDHGAEAMVLAKADYDAEREQLVQAQHTQAQAEAAEHHAFLQTEFKKLTQLAPDLAPDPSDPTKGAKERGEIETWLRGMGYDNKTLARISAEELTIARDAKAYRDLKAKAAAAPKTPPTPPPQRSTVRPAASAPPTNRLQSAQNRFNAAPTPENAQALILARQGTG